MFVKIAIKSVNYSTYLFVVGYLSTKKGLRTTADSRQLPHDNNFQYLYTLELETSKTQNSQICNDIFSKCCTDIRLPLHVTHITQLTV